MKPSYFLFAVALKDPGLLEDILGKSILEAAWSNIAKQIAPQFQSLFVRYTEVSQPVLDHYQCFTWAKINHESLFFDEKEQKEVIFTTGYQFIYEAIIEYFGGGSGRKIAFLMLLKTIDNPVLATPDNVKNWVQTEGFDNAMLLEQIASPNALYENITANELTSIIHEKRLQTYLQSIVELKNRGVVGYEVLTRGPKDSPLERADKLFGAAARFGLTQDIELACIEQALEYLPRLPRPQFLTINVGPDVLISDTLQHWLSLPTVHEKRDQLAFELTEHMPLDDLNKVLIAVQAMQMKGIKIFLDDTGCGFFDITTAETLKPSVVKLCISVIRKIDGGEDIKHEIYHTRKRLEQLGALTLGEGVENAFQADFLNKVGVQYVQGYYFHRPVPIEQILKS
ncbi:MAG: EAL domain-containing protein [Pseudomonadota bacterium]